MTSLELELRNLDAIGQAELVARGDVTPTELVTAAIQRIEATNPALNAVVTTLYDKALAVASDPGLPAGPLRGVPYLLKDHMSASAGDTMFEGMAALRDAGLVEDHDSHVVERYRAAGLVLVGKTNLPELAINITTESVAYGPCHNPWNVNNSPGGSSGGSAAAVASGMVPFAHGTDAGGSIRIPAALCGLVGLKPTHGRVSQAPDFADLWSNGSWHIHGLTRSVRDCAAILDASCGPAPGERDLLPRPRGSYLDEVGADPGRLRIGFIARNPEGFADLHPECRDAVTRTVRLLEDLGHQVEEAHPAGIDQPDEKAGAAFFATVAAGVAWQLDRWSERLDRKLGPDDVEPYTNAFAEMGRAHTAVDIMAALDMLPGLARDVLTWWQDYDVLVTPTMAVPSFELGYLTPPDDDPLSVLAKSTPLVPFCGGFNVTGQPAMSLPLQWTADGGPVGVQFVADFGREDVLFRLAGQLEAAQPWAHRWPLLP